MLLPFSVHIRCYVVVWCCTCYYLFQTRSDWRWLSFVRSQAVALHRMNLDILKLFAVFQIFASCRFSPSFQICVRSTPHREQERMGCCQSSCCQCQCCASCCKSLKKSFCCSCCPPCGCGGPCCQDCTCCEDDDEGGKDYLGKIPVCTLLRVLVLCPCSFHARTLRTHYTSEHTHITSFFSCLSLSFSHTHIH